VLESQRPFAGLVTTTVPDGSVSISPVQVAPPSADEHAVPTSRARTAEKRGRGAEIE
jgi:hypothetical protein